MAQDNEQGNPNEEVVEGQEGDEGEGQVDPLVNLKSEFSRKLENQNSRFNDLNAKLESIYQTVVASKQQQPAQSQVNMRDLIQDDPDAAVKLIENRAVQSASAVVEERMNKAQALQSAVLEIQSKYPEFAQEGSEAAKLAISKASQLSGLLKGTPEGVKMAMLDAASELGLVPASRRQSKQSTDDFSLSGQSQGSARSQRRSDPAKDVKPLTLEFAKLLTPDIASDPKRMASLAKSSGRKRWNQYE